MKITKNVWIWWEDKKMYHWRLLINVCSDPDTTAQVRFRSQASFWCVRLCDKPVSLYWKIASQTVLVTPKHIFREFTNFQVISVLIILNIIEPVSFTNNSTVKYGFKLAFPHHFAGSGSIIFSMDPDPDPDPDLNLAHQYSPPPSHLIFHT